MPSTWASSSYFYDGCKGDEDRLKEQYLTDDKMIPDIRLIKSSAGITNSVTEAREIKRALSGAGIEPRTIAVVLDWPHARSARIIYEKTFPGVRIMLHSVEGKWGKSHRAKLQRSGWKWLIANLGRHFFLRTLGIEYVADIQHPTKPCVES